jgi:DNA-binding response OmpR family regulator
LIPIPRIDVDTASRAKLIAHIDALEDVLSSLLPADDDISWVRHRLGLTLVESRIMVCLLNGRRHTRQKLRTASRYSGDEYATKTIDVLIMRIRRKLKPFGIEIKNDWGSGFYIEGESLQQLRKVLAEIIPIKLEDIK